MNLFPIEAHNILYTTIQKTINYGRFNDFKNTPQFDFPNTNEIICHIYTLKIVFSYKLI
jgi:hypothetical protein